MVAKCAPAKGVDTKRVQNYNAKKAITKFKKHTAHLFWNLILQLFWDRTFGFHATLGDIPGPRYRTRQLAKRLEKPSLAAALFCRWTLVSMLYAKL